VIHLAITDQHLLCVQWTHTELGSLLTGISYKPFHHPLSNVWNSEAEFVSVFSSALQQIRDEVTLEREQIYITVPDQFVRSLALPLDKTMSDSEGWLLARWSFEQRWGTPSESGLAFFGRLFRKDQSQLLLSALHSNLIEPVKLALAEQGASPRWLGTESSVLFGLESGQGVIVLFPERNTIRFFALSEEGYADGTLRLFRGKWKINATNGNLSSDDLQQYRILVGAGFSPKRLESFQSLNPTILSGLEGLDLEGVTVDEAIPVHLFTITRALYAGVQPEQNQINFFGDQGIQNIPVHLPPEPVVKKEPVPAQKPPKRKTKTRTIDQKEKSKHLQKWSSMGITLVLLAFLVGIIYMNKVSPPEKVQKGNGSTTTLPLEKSASEDVSSDTAMLKPILDASISRLDIFEQVLTLMGDRVLFSVNAENDSLVLTFGGSYEVTNELDSLGSVISQTVSPIACCGGYKHVVLLQFPVTKASDHHTWVNYNQLFQSLVIDSSTVKVRSLSPRKFGPFNLIPVIVRARGGETVDRVVKTLRKVEGNVAVEKVVYSNDPVRPNPVAVLFLSLFEASAQPSTSQN
jgi:hypothetical protein